LDETYTDRSGHTGTIRGSVLFAAEWLAGKIQQRSDRLLAYKRINPQGIPNQAWKDSLTSYIFSNGSLPTADAGIASVELQGYAYDALRYAATLDESRANEYNRLAEDVQRATLEKLWMAEDQCFAQGLGTDSSGQERQIDTLTSNAGLLLDSDLLTDLPDETRALYVEGLVSVILSEQFRTAAGLRCRAIRHSGLPGYIDYHGSHVIWPRETFAIARGLERHGYQQEARELYATIITAVQTAGAFYEFFYAEDDGTVWYDPARAIEHFSILNSGRPLDIPEPGQAWTISAAIASSYLLAGIPATEVLTSAEEPTPAIA
jgi:glycogen debranching enzyme